MEENFIIAMISRYLVLSGINLSQTSILVEIQKLALFLIENVSETATTRLETEESLETIEEALPSAIQNLNFPNWNVFEFVTKKEGAAGPRKHECIGYYREK